MKNRFFFIAFLLPVILWSGIPQNFYGVNGIYSSSVYFGDFKRLPGIPNCCPQFETGYGSSFSLAVHGAQYINEKWSISFELGYRSPEGSFKKTENELISIDNEPYNGKFKHTIDFDFDIIDLSSKINYNITNDFMLNAGLDFYSIIGGSYSQVEKIIDPNDRGIFMDSGTPLRNDTAGALKNLSSFNIAPTLGLSYFLPLNKKGSFFIVPNTNIRFGINNMLNNRKWLPADLNFGISLVYKPVQKQKTKPKKEIPIYDKKEPLPKPELEIKEPVITIFGLDDEAAKTKDPKIIVEEFLTTNMYPLLNYIFFKKNSASIQNRYLTPPFEKENALDYYHNIFNIIGKRLNENPEAIITLTGTMSKNEIKKGSSDLSKKRAEKVKDYFINYLNIASKRINIQSQKLPDNPSNSNIDEGAEENRRVEISSKSHEILNPITVSDTVSQITPVSIRIENKIDLSKDLKQWSIELLSNKEVIKSFSGKNNYIPAFELSVEDLLNFTSSKLKPIISKLNITYNDGEKIMAFDTLKIHKITLKKKIREQTDDFLIDKFRLILFNFDKTKLDKRNQNILQNIIKSIKPNSSVIIRGYTDKIGDSDYNLKLSEKRASEVNKYIEHEDSKYEGIGENRKLFDNQLPEGRFYSRTVMLIVRTPIEWKKSGDKK